MNETNVFSRSEAIDYFALMSRAVEAHFSETFTIPTTPLILLCHDESEIPIAIGLLVPISDPSKDKSLSEIYREGEQSDSLRYYVFCKSYNLSNLNKIIIER